MESPNTTDKEKVDPDDSIRETGDASTELQREDVLCDFCIDGPGKALKSCLTCQVSYCQAHLRPHRENAKFQSHRLVDPLHDVEHLTCELHRLPMEKFCQEDGRCLCLDCERQEHDGHTTVSLKEARAESEVTTMMPQFEHFERMSLSNVTAHIFFSPFFFFLQAEMQRKQEEISRSVLAAEQEIIKLQSNSDSTKVCYYPFFLVFKV